MIARPRDVGLKQFRQSGLPSKLSFLLILAFFSINVGCKQSSKEMPSRESSMSIEVTSTAFQQGMTIPQKYTGDGEKKSKAFNAPKLYKAKVEPAIKDDSESMW